MDADMDMMAPFQCKTLACAKLAPVSDDRLMCNRPGGKHIVRNAPYPLKKSSNMASPKTDFLNADLGAMSSPKAVPRPAIRRPANMDASRSPQSLLSVFPDALLSVASTVALSYAHARDIAP
jgi:hypothetical protein